MREIVARMATAAMAAACVCGCGGPTATEAIAPGPAAVLATWRRGHARDVPALVERLRDKDPAVRCLAGWALRGMAPGAATDPLAGLLRDENPAARMQAARLLAELGDARGFEAFEGICANGDEVAVRTALTYMRTLAGPRIARALFRLFARERALWLGFENRAGWLLRATDANVGEFVAALSDPNREVVRQAIWGLGDRRRPEAVEPLIALMNRGGDSLNRDYAARALGKIGDPRGLAALVDAARKGLVDDLQAAFALRDSGKRDAVPYLLEMLGDARRNEVVVSVAAEGLGETGDPSAVGPLVQALGHPYWGVGQAAGRALAKITGKDFGADAAKWRAWLREKERQHVQPK